MTDPEETGKGRVLVVDDRVANCDLLRQELEDEGFAVNTAFNGIQCLEKARLWSPHVIVLDIKMPGMDGMETCRRLKANTVTSHIPVLFLTGHRADEETCLAGFNAGANDFLPKPFSRPILLARISSQIQICRSYLRIQELAMTDEVTGIFSRRALITTLRQHVRETKRAYPDAVSFLIVDVDYFKAINDTLGHLTGDQVLRRVAEAISGSLRMSDTAGRLGGDEFGVVLPHTALEGARKTAEKVRAAVQEQMSDVRHGTTVSIGVASTPGSLRGADAADEQFELLLRNADAALYAAKSEGRNQVCVSNDYRSSTELDAQGGDNRRHHPRLGVPVTVELSGVKGPGKRRTANVSAGGLALWDDSGLAVGDRIHLCLHLSDTPVEVEATVVWKGLISGERSGCGVAFESFREDGADVLTRFLARYT